MPRPLRRTLPVALLLAAATPAGAQTVRGLLADRDSGRPIEGAMVWLVDSGGRRSGVLTDSLGRFFLRAPAAGRYTALAERIGFADAVSDTFEVGAHEFVDVRITAEPRAIPLAALVAEGDQRCEIRPAEGLRSARLWEEARKALSVAAWTRSEQLYRYEVARFQRALDPFSLRPHDETRSTFSTWTRNPIRAVSIDLLERQGYIHGEPDGSWTYYAPDAHVLLSDQFLDSHCFRPRDGGRAQPGLVGLAFQPVRNDRRTTDIEGTLWIDAGSGELRFIEFRYTRLPYRVSARAIGGRIDLERLPNGAWIVRRWYIRMPRVAMATAAGPHFLLEIVESGGEVVSYRAGG
jgi:hypothetical protein